MTKQITVIGLGAGTIEQIPLGVYRQLKSNENKLFVRTEDHPVIHTLKQEGITFEAFDYVYEKHEEFEKVYEEIVNILLNEVEKDDIIFAVPGHPMLAERTVKLLLEKEKTISDLTIKITGGQSYLDSLFQALRIDPVEGFQFVDATSFHRFDLQFSQHIVFTQVYDEMVASEVKLTLMEDLPHDYPIVIVNAAGTNEEAIKEVPLYELDRSVQISNLMSIYIPPVEKEKRNHQFNRLREVIATLRGPGGCPWDQKQTHESLRPYLIEEAYEVIEAINDSDDEMIAEELGDVLLQIMLHSQIGEEKGYFSVDDVIRKITDKMIRRHPHVFDNSSLETADEVAKQWEDIKKEEKGDNSSSSLLDGIEKALPALLYAFELQKRAAKVGFDWSDIKPIWNKVYEEIKEFEIAIENKQIQDAEREFGDILFSFVNLARYYNINPELAIQQTNTKFKARFEYIERKAQEKGYSLQEMSLEDMDKLWEEAKHN